jgi:ketosteroid isomerase-like protein
MSAEQNKALVRRFFEARVKTDLDAVDQMLAPDFIASNLPGADGQLTIQKLVHRADRWRHCSRDSSMVRGSSGAGTGEDAPGMLPPKSIGSFRG